MKDPLHVFIGFDPREAIVYHTCVQSIIENCSEPDRLRFAPVTGARRDGSNDFVYARFLVPYRCQWRGVALFLDGDMVVRGDVAELLDGARLDVGVSVVKHPDYETKHPVKYLGSPNQNYPRKNWSSVVVWNNGFWPNRQLTPEFVNLTAGSYLHRFGWLPDERIGALPEGWNRLVLEQDIKAEDRLLHYTIGAPCFAEYRDCDGAEEWLATFRRAASPLEV